MPSIEYVLWAILTFLSLVIVRVLYRRNLTPIEKMVFSGVAGFVFFFLIGAFWFFTGKKLDQVAYEAILCPLSLSRCEPPPDERERKEQAKVERGRERQAMLERTKPVREELARLEREREERARLEREREERARLERERRERAKLEREREERARLERKREERARLERERKEREQAKLEREREERAKLERQREERAKLEREREERAKLERGHEEEEQRPSQRFAAMAVGISGRRLFAITARDMPSFADAQVQALARCNQEVPDCRIEATFSGAGKCGYAAAGIAHAPLFGASNIPGGVRTGPTATEAIQRCEAVFQKCYIFHTSCNSP